MNVQWFPGHMTKTRRQIAEDLKLVDIVYELVDARLPMSSRNPEIDMLLGDKPRIVIINKADLADPDINEKWLEYFKAQDIPAVLVSSSDGKGINGISPLVNSILKDKLAKRAERGITGELTKVMIVGIPNVGKSTLINKLAGRAGAKTGDRPGVTKGKQWITVKNKFMLLDTPGILWPKFDDEEAARRLAFSGAIKDEILDVEELAVYLIAYLRQAYPDKLCERYKITLDEKEDYEILEDIGRKRGCAVRGGEVDTYRAANMLLDEFRAAKIGNISLEVPQEEE